MPQNLNRFPDDDPLPTDITEQSSATDIYDALVRLRAEKTNERFEQETVSAFWPLFDTYNLIKEANWINKDMAKQMAGDFLDKVHHNQHESTNILPIDPGSKLHFYESIHEFALLQPDEPFRSYPRDTLPHVTLRSAWQQAIIELTEPFEKAFQEFQFSKTFEEIEHQKTQSEKTTRTFMSLLQDTPAPLEEVLTQENIRTLRWFCEAVQNSESFYAIQPIRDYMHDLYTTGRIHTFDAESIRITLNILDQGSTNDTILQECVNTVVLTSKERAYDSFAAVVHQMSDMQLTTARDTTDVLDIKSNYKVFSCPLDLEELSMWLAVFGVKSTKPSQENVQQFKTNQMKYFSLLEKTCGYYLRWGHVDTVLSYLRLIKDENIVRKVLHALQEHAYNTNDTDLLVQSENTYLESMREDQKEGMYEIELGKERYVSAKIRKGEIGTLILDAKIEKVLRKDTSWHTGFVKSALTTLPPDHRAYQLAQDILQKKILDGQQGKIEKIDFIDFLDSLLYIKTHGDQHYSAG